FAHYQKFQLFVCSCDLMNKVARVEGNLRGARALAERFVTFRSQYWFNEVTCKPQGGELYRKLQESLEVHGLYQMVTSSVKEVKEYFEERRSRRNKLVLDLIALVTTAYGAAKFWWGAAYPLWTKFAALAVLAGGAAVGGDRPRGGPGGGVLLGRPPAAPPGRSVGPLGPA